MAEKKQDAKSGGFTRYVTPLVAWALAFGCAVGWGSFVMPGTTFLPTAGLWGSVLGILAGGVVMVVIAVNYHHLMQRYPDPGGSFTFVKKTLNYDHGFVCAWFLALTYIAIIWANATALPLIGRNLLGSMFQFGFSYEVAGFTIYFGELMLAIGALAIAALLCMNGKAGGAVQSIMALVLIVGIVVCFTGVVLNNPSGQNPFESDMVSGLGSAVGFANIVAMAPWAYIGFESISHSSREFTFSPTKSFKIMAIALVCAAAAYALLVVIATFAHPSEYATWPDYIADIGNLQGYAGLPTLYAIESALGPTGATIMGFTALGGIVTGLIGCFIASSRLLYSMALDNMLPSSFAKLNSRGAPQNALLFILGISVIVPLFGRTATSWVVDVTTVGAAFAYFYVSYCAYRVAREEGKGKRAIVCGVLGSAFGALFLLAFLVPNVLMVNALSTESYLILAAWSILGFAFFRLVFKRDEAHRFGRSIVVWIALFSLVLFTSFIWVRQSTENVTEEVMDQIHAAYVQSGEEAGETSSSLEDEERFAEAEIQKVGDSTQMNSLVQMLLIVIALIFVFDVYRIVQKRERRLEVDKARAEESSRAKTSFLSNMSHEIRTPMNAIIGLDNIALKDPDLSPRTREQLEKIGSSAKHLLGLINDILDMSRIESGRMSLKDEEFLFRSFLDQVSVIINGQCQDKGLEYHCHIVGHVDDYYVGDDMKLRQVLINILGNSVKFTDPPGQVTLTVEQTSSFEGLRTLRFSMADTGIGMDEEYIPTIFEAFSQEDESNTNKYGGSGLGMAITKNIVEMMNGDISVESEKGVGTTFTVIVTLKACARSAQGISGQRSFEHLSALIVDDDEVACEHAQIVLSELGIASEICLDTAEALERIRRRRDAGGPYDLILSDYVMPSMNGIQFAGEVRKLVGEQPGIILLTGYSFDEMSEEAGQADVDALLAKPLFSDTLLREIYRMAARRLPEEEAPEADGESGDAEVDSFEGKLGGLTVLLAEDVDINAEIMLDVLDMEDIVAERAENGKIALDMFAASEIGAYDAVLMDVRMPTMDGLEATGAIRKLDRADAATVPIIALTANAFEEDVQRSLQAGMNAHLSKPVDPDQLFNELYKLAVKKG